MSLWKWLSIYLVAVCPVKWVEIRYCVQEIHFIVHLAVVCISSTWSFSYFCLLHFLCSSFILLANTFFRFVKLLSVNCIVATTKYANFSFHTVWKFLTHRLHVIFEWGVLALFLVLACSLSTELKWVWAATVENTRIDWLSIFSTMWNQIQLFEIESQCALQFVSHIVLYTQCTLQSPCCERWKI